MWLNQRGICERRLPWTPKPIEPGLLPSPSVRLVCAITTTLMGTACQSSTRGVSRLSSTYQWPTSLSPSAIAAVYRQRLGKRNPMERVRRPRVPQKSPRLTMEEIERLLDAIAEQSFPERDLAMILLNASEGESRRKRSGDRPETRFLGVSQTKCASLGRRLIG
jgi:hypothetical protein